MLLRIKLKCFDRNFSVVGMGFLPILEDWNFICTNFSVYDKLLEMEGKSALY